MANQRRRSIAATFAFLAAGSLAAAAAYAQDRPPAPGGRPGEGFPVGPLDRVCHVVLQIGNSDGGHLLNGQRIRLIGPIPPDNNVIVSRVSSNAVPSPPPHQWRNGLFTATRVTPASQTNPPWLYLLSDVRVKGGDHDPERTHPYVMTIETLDPTDRCPKAVTLYTPEHQGDSGDDHPGHANALR